VDWADPILEAPLRIQEGAVTPPDRPGIGISWNEDAVRRYQI
jgi:mandelate racemase